MLVNQVDKRIRMTKWDLVKFQLLFYCHLKEIDVSDSDLNCLTHLAIHGEQELSSFCSHTSGIFSSAQSVRNCINKSAKKGLVVKMGKNKKRVGINPDIEVIISGNVLLKYNILSVETT